MKLTCREAEITKLLVQGLTNKEIGKKLKISEYTARDHISSILKKTKTSNRVELAVKIIALDILD
ncbi:LuxR C-terminal-related transcriptional regulator [Pseudomonas sivasensis]|uniref:LuxR C-terminal-related transcriptional regulator n=1 Tax=Pseudomonas sivasensis TaxID=1880678 RepID=A0ABW8E2Q6_9PSED